MDAPPRAHDAASSPPAAERPVPAPRHRDWRPLASVAVVALLVALPLRALYLQTGSPMEEGFMLTFPERILAGDVPHRDFLHLYGPGSLWVLAVVYEVVGTSLAAERTVGLVQHLLVIAGVLVLAWPFGRRVATVCAVVAVFLTVTPIGLAALAWSGGVALALSGLVAGLHGRRLARHRRALPRPAPDASGPGSGLAAAGGPPSAAATVLLAAAGVLGAAALLYRPDLFLAVGLSYGAVAWRLDRPHLVRFLGPMAALLLVGYGVHLLLAGPEDAVRGMFVEPVFELRAGRRLPAPPPWDGFDGALDALAQLVVPGWSLPAPAGPQQVVIWFFLLPAVALFEVLSGWRRLRADPTAWKGTVMLAVGLLALGMLPQALQRPDATHLAWVSCVSLSLLPMHVADVVASRRGSRRTTGAVVALTTALVLLFAVIPHFTLRPWVELTRQALTRDFSDDDVVRGDRNFYLGNEPVTPAAQAVVDELDRRSAPGERLLVGTADLRLTPYSDAFFYFLFPELTPATRYIEMDPGIANAEDSGLAEDVASADWLILSHVWDFWDEPNDARVLGSDVPNQVVARDFCLVDRYGDPAAPDFLLYERCR